MKTRLIIVIIIAILLLLGTVSATYFYFRSKSASNQSTDDSTSTNQEKDESDQENSANTEDSAQDEEDASEGEQEYYGSSLLGTCDCGCDCVTDGCNGEICRSRDDEGVGTICSIPDKPLPGDLGYSCTCVQSQCQWTK